MPTGTRGWALGHEYPYRVSMASAIAFGDQPAVIDFDLDGQLLVIPVAVASGQTTLFVAVRNAKVVSRAPDPKGQIAAIGEQASSTGCLLTLVAGRVSEIRLANDLNSLTVGIYRELGARLQFAPTSDAAPKYEVEEYDATGKYTAEYARDDAAGLRFHKRKLRYAGVLGADTAAAGTAAAVIGGPGKVVPEIAVSQGEITLSAEGRPVQVRMHDEVSISGAQTPVHSKTTISLVGGESVSGSSHDFAAMAAQLTRFGADEAYVPKTQVAALDAARIHGLTYDRVIERLSALRAAHPDVLNGTAPTDATVKTRDQAAMQELSGLFMALGAIFRQQPAAIPRAVAQIRAHSPLSGPLIDALGSSGASTAHVALVELSRSSALDQKIKNRALVALIRTPNPSSAAIAALEKMLKDDPFSETALYGLGTYARHLRDAGNRDEAARIASVLGDSLERAGAVKSRVETVLAAIANSGSEQLLPRVAPFLTDRADGVRAIAVRALQSMHDPQVDTLIAARMATDTASEVRIAAMDAAGVREPADLVVRALREVAVSDDDPRVRYRGVDLLTSWLPKRNELRTTLQVIASKDPEPQVRSRAQAAL